MKLRITPVEPEREGMSLYEAGAINLGGPFPMVEGLEVALGNVCVN